jgi:hypothetical protein
MGWMAGAAVVVAVIILCRTDASLNRRIADLQKEFNEQQTELQRAR